MGQTKRLGYTSGSLCSRVANDVILCLINVSNFSVPFYKCQICVRFTSILNYLWCNFFVMPVFITVLLDLSLLYLILGLNFIPKVWSGNLSLNKAFYNLSFDNFLMVLGFCMIWSIKNLPMWEVCSFVVNKSLFIDFNCSSRFILIMSIFWQIVIQVLFYPVIYGFKFCKMRPTSKYYTVKLW